MTEKTMALFKGGVEVIRFYLILTWKTSEYLHFYIKIKCVIVFFTS